MKFCLRESGIFDKRNLQNGISFQVSEIWFTSQIVRTQYWMRDFAVQVNLKKQTILVTDQQ